MLWLISLLLRIDLNAVSITKKQIGKFICTISLVLQDSQSITETKNRRYNLFLSSFLIGSKILTD